MSNYDLQKTVLRFCESNKGFLLLIGQFLIVLVLIVVVYFHVTLGLTLNDKRINRVLDHNFNGINPPIKLECGWQSVIITPPPKYEEGPGPNESKRTSSS